MTPEKWIAQYGQRARTVAPQLARLDTATKNSLLRALAPALRAATPALLAANQEDLARATANGRETVMLDRLRLDAGRIDALAAGVEAVAALADPIGTVLGGHTSADGLEILQKRVPLGVVAMIFESRPNVAVDAFALAFKTGNAIILRGGSDAQASNRALVAVIRATLTAAGLPADAVQLLADGDRATATALMRARDWVDVLIPRGGAQLIATVKNEARVPVIETGVGNVHIYVDAGADLAMATRVVVNAKTQRPSVCNAVETLLVHRAEAERFLPGLAAALDAVHPVQLRADDRARAWLPTAIPATAADYDTEFLDYVLAVAVVDELDDAISWINRHGSGHSEAILTRDLDRARRFQEEVDAAVVYVNASTRFTDGFVFGLGAEIGISTQKMHARGPMGLEALTSSKFYVRGSGQVRG